MALPGHIQAGHFCPDAAASDKVQPLDLVQDFPVFVPASDHDCETIAHQARQREEPLTLGHRRQGLDRETAIELRDSQDAGRFRGQIIADLEDLIRASAELERVPQSVVAQAEAIPYYLAGCSARDLDHVAL